MLIYIDCKLEFQSTLTHGSDPHWHVILTFKGLFQSTLTHGSDSHNKKPPFLEGNFNPRSLTGATPSATSVTINQFRISIHAHSRERLLVQLLLMLVFNFNPRSLTGATEKFKLAQTKSLFQSTLTHGSDSIKMMYFYNYVNQAFVANKLN